MNGAGNKGMFLHVWTESQHDFPSDLESYFFWFQVSVQLLVKDYAGVNQCSWLENQLLQEEMHHE